MRTRYFWNPETKSWDDTPAVLAKRLQIVNDDMEAHSQATGKYFSSKSKYRADLKARGFIEVGNERLVPQRDPIKVDLGNDMRRTMDRMG